MAKQTNTVCMKTILFSGHLDCQWFKDDMQLHVLNGQTSQSNTVLAIVHTESVLILITRRNQVSLLPI